ncbi:MAG: M15 family metallopeptidase [Candidatus Aquicultor sp.]|nr:M15 family metallopeptidase [Candidatus Aquicultor sp.]
MPLSQEGLKKVFGSFNYRENPRKRGAVIIDPAWVRAHIVSISTPFGRFRCHSRISYQMESFVREACEEKLVTDIGGIWVARHILWDPRRPISGHAYGCDIDINVDDGRDGPGGRLNYGGNSFQPAGLLELADKWGFEWGGDWRRNKDGMHFSCVRVIAKTGAAIKP